MTEDEREPRPAPLIVELGPPLAVVRFNRPAERNPLSTTTLNHLDAAVSALTARSDLKAIIFTGTGDVFASGADIREIGALRPEAAEGFARRGQQLFQRITDAKQVTIAAVNGYCMGGALDLALACRLRYAASDALFAHPGARLGIITGWGGTQRLPRLIGMSRALEILLTARRVTSEEALRIGLVNQIGDPVLDCACEAALKLS
jgi:enoyl-CoA hydratase